MSVLKENKGFSFERAFSMGLGLSFNHQGFCGHSNLI